MEAFTSGKVSNLAKRAYLESRPGFSADNFAKIRGGWTMYAWESQIAFARAMGRGAASGRDRPVHRFDERPLTASV